MSGVRLIGQFPTNIRTKRFGGFPIGAVFIEAAEGGVVSNATFRLVFPECGLNEAEPYFVGGLSLWFDAHGHFAASWSAATKGIGTMFASCLALVS